MAKGSALMRGPTQGPEAIIRRRPGRMYRPDLVKMRTGWNETEFLALPELAKQAEAAGAQRDHGTAGRESSLQRKDGSPVPLSSGVSIPVISNSDITNGRSAAPVFTKRGCQAIP